jgi:hypothetical protein
LCVDVQVDPGHCVDWSRIGATPCPGGPLDCPATLPSASFPPGAGSVPIAMCVAKDRNQYRDPPSRFPLDAGAPEPGYCAAFQSALLAAGMGTCTPNPCGPNAHCSLIYPTEDLVVVECVWPL